MCESKAFFKRIQAGSPRFTQCVPNTEHRAIMSATTDDLVAETDAQHTRTTEAELGEVTAENTCVFLTDLSSA